MLEQKLKQHLIYLYTRQGGRDWQKLGRAIDWRLDIARRLAGGVRRGSLPFSDFQAAVAGLTIQRQIEDELDRYQQALRLLAGELQDRTVSVAEYTARVEALTAAIAFVSYLEGAREDSNELREASGRVLSSQGRDDTAVAVVNDQEIIEQAIIDAAARNEIDSELAIAATSAAALGEALAAGTYEETEEALLSRLAMWGTTALGVYALGQTQRRRQFFEWLLNPLKDSCSDCIRLSGQIHTGQEWRWSGWRPQSRGLACGGWRCGCGFAESSGPGQGDF